MVQETRFGLGLLYKIKKKQIPVVSPTLIVVGGYMPLRYLDDSRALQEGFARKAGRKTGQLMRSLRAGR